MSQDRARVARYVIARRGELGLTQQGLAGRAGVDIKTIYNLESGERWPQAKTRGALEAALSWYPGDLQRIAHGGEPVVYERPSSRRELLADHIRTRMDQLRLTWADVARDAGIPEEEIHDLRRQMTPEGHVKLGLERALRWEPGSIDAIFDTGKEPATVERRREERHVRPSQGFTEEEVRQAEEIAERVRNDPELARAVATLLGLRPPDHDRADERDTA
jgi:transcriptional regulator with XRE-family HTH domain